MDGAGKDDLGDENVDDVTNRSANDSQEYHMISLFVM